MSTTASSFSVDSLPDLTGKVAIVTGGNAGLGYQDAKALLLKNAHVIITGRSKERLEAAVSKLVQETKKTEANIEYMMCDLASLEEIEKFTDAFRAKNLPIHILINNAGLAADKPDFTKDGVAFTFGVNYLGHFYLTVRLLDIIEKSAPARIINVSSDLHKQVNSNMDLASLTTTPNNGLNGYNLSKFANVLFTKSLVSRLAKSNVFVNTVHPGFSQSEMASKQTGILKYIIQLSSMLFATKVEVGALSTIYAAASPDIETKNYRGEYFGPASFFAKDQTSICAVNNLATDDAAEELWQWSSKIVKEKRGYVVRI